MGEVQASAAGQAGATMGIYWKTSELTRLELSGGAQEWPSLVALI